MLSRLYRILNSRFRKHSATRLALVARHVEASAIASADDDPGKPSDQLIDLALKSADRARSVSMARLVSRMKVPPFYPDIWPGEHYKLLAGIVLELQPKRVVEIGTYTGMSALSMLEYLPEGATLHTFDIIPWSKVPDTCLTEADFSSPRLVQIIGDVADPLIMKRYEHLLSDADLIFVDGPKDGVFEHRFLERIREIRFLVTPVKPLLVFDDIRLWNMLPIWRAIEKPKLDLTSFGHWSGTGLVHWQ